MLVAYRYQWIVNIGKETFKIATFKQGCGFFSLYRAFHMGDHRILKKLEIIFV